MQHFKIIESPIMAEELASAFPNIKTFSLKGIDDPYANGKLDWNEFGFHGMILSVNGDFFIDPYCNGDLNNYIIYYTNDFVKDPSLRIPENQNQEKKIKQEKENNSKQQEKTGARTSSPSSLICAGGHLRKYRLAISCTGEYAVAATGLGAPSLAQTQSKIVTSINRVDGVYEKEVAIRMVLVATNTAVIYTAISTDPYATGVNNDGSTLINRSEKVIDSLIGNSNYDIGHTFSTGGGGLANIGCVCVTGDKAHGITGSPSPVGDPYDIDYVCHEMGHQFGGEHSFNSNTSNCGSGNRYGPSSVEPGSGVTIMAYAGICGINDLASNSIPYFHAISYDQLINYSNLAQGNNCAVNTITGNQPPVVIASATHTIPKYTPFDLSGSATDPDGDVLTYSWEETDIGSGSGNDWNSGFKPFFRSYPPTTSPIRSFPNATVLATGNYTTTKGEFLPTSAQSLQFRLTARDNKMGGGGVCSATNNILVDNSGPFSVLYPSATNIAWGMGTQRMISWSVNGTDVAPVDCDSVSIWISYNGGNSYNILVGSTPNNGSKSIVAPTVASIMTACRIKIMGKGNIFYDVSDNNFTISTDPLAGIKEVSFNNPMNLEIWPNPTDGKLNFNAANLTSTDPTFVTIVDVLGKTILQSSYAQKTELKETLDISDLKKGIYFMKVNNANKLSVHRIIKE